MLEIFGQFVQKHSEQGDQFEQLVHLEEREQGDQFKQLVQFGELEQLGATLLYPRSEAAEEDANGENEVLEESVQYRQENEAFLTWHNNCDRDRSRSPSHRLSYLSNAVSSKPVQSVGDCRKFKQHVVKPIDATKLD